MQLLVLETEVERALAHRLVLLVVQRRHEGCCSASATVMRFRGLMRSMRASRSRHSGEALGNCWARGTTGLLGSLHINRSAFSEVTKSRSSSGSLPSFVVMMVSCDVPVKMSGIEIQRIKTNWA